MGDGPNVLNVLNFWGIRETVVLGSEPFNTAGQETAQSPEETSSVRR
jgi:hypothetical protein